MGEKRLKRMRFVTISQARKLLGSKYIVLSDVEVESKISSLGMIAESLVDAVLKKLDTIECNEASSNSS
jgi:hypothetical protein